MKVALLAGGTGGTKLAHGFAMLGPSVELTVIANVGDDFELHGLHICPDIDTLLYTLSGLVDPAQGWGIRGDTRNALAMLGRLGAPTWFSVGDADLAIDVERTRRLRQGERLTDVIAALASALAVGPRILPATDDRFRTLVETDDGELEFQDYFVRLRHEPEVRSVRFDGGDAARATIDVMDALTGADSIVIGPSNPIVSIGPILELPGVRDAVAKADAVAVSPIIGGRALKGPADRMLASLGHEASALGVARLYAGLVDRFVLDEIDAAFAPAVEALGMRVDVLPTVMSSDEGRRALAQAVVRLPA